MDCYRGMQRFASRCCIHGTLPGLPRSEQLVGSLENRNFTILHKKHLPPSFHSFPHRPLQPRSHCVRGAEPTESCPSSSGNRRSVTVRHQRRAALWNRWQLGKKTKM